jgi:WD40 repeat protein
MRRTLFSNLSLRKRLVCLGLVAIALGCISIWMNSLWDRAAPKETAEQLARHYPALYTIFVLAASSDNQVIAGGYGDGTIRLWNSGTLSQIQECKGQKGRILALVLSPDGKTLFSSAMDHTVRAWNWVEGKEINQFSWPEGDALSLALSPDGKILAGAGGEQYNFGKVRAIHLWNTEDGQEIRQLIGHHQNILALAFSPNGRTLASASGDRTVRLWDTATGQEIKQLGLYGNWVGLLAFSPDGQTVAAGLEYDPLHLWNAQTGIEVGRVNDHPPAVASVRFSQDGAFLAYVNADRKIGLWEVDSGRPIRQFTHQGGVNSFVFSRDGKKLISAGGFSPDIKKLISTRPDILISDLSQPAPFAPLSQEDLEKLWSDLAGDNAGRAFDAGAILAANPGLVLPFMDRHLHAVPPIDDKQIAQWIINLDNDVLETREMAARDLERIGRRAGPLLQQTFAGQPSAEVKSRAKNLLEKLDQLVIQGEKLRDVRAVRVLEWIDTPQSREILKRLANGERQARLTVVAQTSLNLLEKASSTPQVLAEEKQNPPAELSPAPFHQISDDPFQPGVLISRLGSPYWITDTPVNFVAFGPDDKIVSAGGEIFVWHRNTGQQFIRFGRYPQGISAFSLSRYGNFLACSAHDPVIHLWDPTTGKEVRQFRTANREVQCLAFSPNETILVSGGDLNLLEIWSVAEGRLIKRVIGHDGGCTSIVFSPDGKTIASGGGDHKVRLWDAASGEELRELGVYMGKRDAIAFSPDGNFLATEGLPYAVDLREVTSGKEIRKFKGGSSNIRSLHFSPTGKMLAALFDKWNTVMEWNVETGKVGTPCSQPFPLESFVYSRGGVLMATASRDHTVRIWDASRWKEAPLKGVNEASLTAITFSPDDTVVTAAGRFNSIRSWDVASGKEVPRPQQTPGWHRSVTFSSDGKLGASIRASGQGEVWDVATGKVIFTIGKSGDSIHGLALFPDGKTVAASYYNEVRFWDLATEKQLPGPNEQTKATPTLMVFCPDGKRVIWPDITQGLALRDALSGKEMEWLDKRPSPFRPVVFSPNGKTLITSGEGVRIWELATLQERCNLTLNDRLFEAGCLAVSPDGRMLATSDMGINLWDLATGREIGRIVGHPLGETSLVFSHDSRRLASGSDKQGCLVWDLQAMARSHIAPPPMPSPQDLEQLWKEVATPDAPKAFKAIGQLVSYSDVTTVFLGKRLRPAPAIDPVRISRLISDLDADEFTVREKAAAELEQLGEWVKPNLRAALQGNPSLEMKAQIINLLDKTPRVTVPPEHLRDLRALEILEFIGTNEAKLVLENLAKGALQAKLTQDAKSALTRFSKKPNS